MSDEPRVTRRVFLTDALFLGGGVLASIAWAWAHSSSPPPATPTSREFDHPVAPGQMIAVPATPSPSPSSAKKRPPEFDHTKTDGDVMYAPTDKPR